MTISINCQLKLGRRIGKRDSHCFSHETLKRLLGALNSNSARLFVLLIATEASIYSQVQLGCHKMLMSEFMPLTSTLSRLETWQALPILPGEQTARGATRTTPFAVHFQGSQEVFVTIRRPSTFRARFRLRVLSWTVDDQSFRNLCDTGWIADSDESGRPIEQAFRIASASPELPVLAR